jgi:hypothetical protein
MGIGIGGAIKMFGPVLIENGDVSLAPNIPKRKLRNAMRTYGRPHATPESTLLLVDNTLLRSAKDGLIITSTHLLGRSGPGGVVSVPLVDIVSVIPDLRSLAGFPIPGIIINSEHFIALPGMVRKLDSVEYLAIYALVAMLIQALGLELPSPEFDPDFNKAASDFNKGDFNK